MIKKLFVILLLCVLGAPQFLSAAPQCSLADSRDYKGETGGTFGGVWPWGNEAPFPWKGIQGTWFAENGSCKSFFAFKVAKVSTDGEHILKVINFDPDTCAVISSGAGYEIDRIVTAVMTSTKGPFELNIRAFSEDSFKDTDLDNLAEGKFVTVMNSTRVGGPTSAGASYRLHKMSSNPNYNCNF